MLLFVVNKDVNYVQKSSDWCQPTDVSRFERENPTDKAPCLMLALSDSLCPRGLRLFRQKSAKWITVTL